MKGTAPKREAICFGEHEALESGGLLMLDMTGGISLASGTSVDGFKYWLRTRDMSGKHIPCLVLGTLYRSDSGHTGLSWIEPNGVLQALRSACFQAQRAVGLSDDWPSNSYGTTAFVCATALA
jgi:hypothetical protein